MKDKKKIPIIAALGLAICTSTAYAEGSRDLVGHTDTNASYPHYVHYPGFRPYMSAETGKNADITRRTIVYVYAKQGETISFGSNSVYDNKYTNFSGHDNRKWLIISNFNSLTSNNPFNDAKWLKWDCKDKYATIAVTVHSPNAENVSSIDRFNVDVDKFVSGFPDSESDTNNVTGASGTDSTGGTDNTSGTESTNSTNSANDTESTNSTNGASDTESASDADDAGATDIISSTGSTINTNTTSASSGNRGIEYATPNDGYIYLFSPQSGSDTRCVYDSTGNPQDAKVAAPSTCGDNVVKTGYIENQTQEKYGPNGVIMNNTPKSYVEITEQAQSKLDSAAVAVSDEDEVTEEGTTTGQVTEAQIDAEILNELNTPVTEGYTPFTFVAPADATYAFHFLAPICAGGQDPVPDDLSTDTDDNNVMWSYDDHGEMAKAPVTVGMWDVTVSDRTTNKAIPGRVWTDFLHLNMGNQEKDIYTNFYVLTKDGFEYQVDCNGMKPYGYTFFSNNRGFLFDEGNSGNSSNYQSFNHSYFSRDSEVATGTGTAPFREDLNTNGETIKTSIFVNAVPVDKTKDIIHKIFLNKPDTEALRVYTDSGSLRTSVNENSSGEITFTGEGSSKSNWEDETRNEQNYVMKDETDESGQTTSIRKEYNKGTEGIGGYFTIKLPQSDLVKSGENSFSICIDFSGYELKDDLTPARNSDGSWHIRVGDETQNSFESSNKVLLCTNSFTETDETDANGNKYYSCRVNWNGRDAYDNIVPPGVYDQVISSYWQEGTAHFPMLDVEENPNGIKIKMLNNIMLAGDPDNDKVYYNNAGKSAEGPSAWYFFYNKTQAVYHDIRIGDGQNHIDGVSSNFGKNGVAGAMAFGSYTDKGPWYRDKETGDIKYLTNGKSLGYGDYTAIDIWKSYSTTPTTKHLVLGINPRSEDRALVTPYVSFVAEKKENKLNELGTHVGYFDVTWKSSAKTNDTDDTDSTSDAVKSTFCGREVESKAWKNKEYNYYGASDEENYYGNTVSTEFVTGFVPGDLYTYSKLRWTIDIPADSTYIKAVNSNSFTLSKNTTVTLGEEKLKDSAAESVINAPKVNGGSIYKVSGFTSTAADESGTGNTNIGTLKLVYDLKTQCSGNTNIVFGLVIDNLYAPEALATEARFETGDFKSDNEYIEIAAPDENGTQPNGTVRGVFAESSQGYYQHKDNEYWNVDPDNPNRTNNTNNTNNTDNTNTEESEEKDVD